MSESAYPSVDVVDAKDVSPAGYKIITLRCADKRKSFGLGLTQRNTVGVVSNDGLGKICGIKSGDQILRVDGAEVTSQAFNELLRAADLVAGCKLEILQKEEDGRPESISVDIDKDGRRYFPPPTYSTPEPQVEQVAHWWDTPSYKKMVLEEWSKSVGPRDVVMEALSKGMQYETGGAIREMNSFAGPQPRTAAAYGKLFEWCEAERKRIEEQQSWPLISVACANTIGPGAASGCGWDSRCEHDLSFLPSGPSPTLFEDCGWSMEPKVSTSGDEGLVGLASTSPGPSVTFSSGQAYGATPAYGAPTEYSATYGATPAGGPIIGVHLYTHYELFAHEPLRLRTGKAPQIILNTGGGMLKNLKVGDVVVAIDGVLITRSTPQVSAILDSFEVGREFVVVVRRKGATSDGTDMSKLEPSNSDPPATEGANKPACCSIL